MTIVYAVSEHEYVTSETTGISITLFPSVKVDLEKVIDDFNEAKRLILFPEKTEAEGFAKANSKRLKSGAKTTVHNLQRAILEMSIDDELLKDRATQPVDREIHSDVKFQSNPVAINTANAYVINKAEILVPPTFLKLTIAAQSKDFTPSLRCTIL